MSATVRTLDFSGVPEGGGAFRPRRRTEGDYFAHIVKVDDHKSKSDNDTWLFTIKVDGDPRASYPYYVGTDDNQLWKVRALFIACGIPVPSKRVKADPNKLVGRPLGIAIIDDEYEGRIKGAIDAVFPVTDMDDPLNEAGSKSSKAKSRQADDDEDDEEDEPPVKSKSKGKSKPPPVEDDEDDDDEEPEPPKRKSKAKAKPEPDEDDEDENDEDEAPPAKTKSKSKAKGKKSKPAPDDDDDEDDLDLDDL